MRRQEAKRQQTYLVHTTNNCLKEKTTDKGQDKSEFTVLFFYSMPVFLRLVIHWDHLGNFKNADIWTVTQILISLSQYVGLIIKQFLMLFM